MNQNPSPTQRRASLLRKFIDIEKGVGLEFGPLANPVVAKSEGTIYYLDHLSTEGLRNKYANDKSIDISKIVPVDIVMDNDLSVLESFGPFDYVIASHVFEHLANPIAWLQRLASYLKLDATLAMAIPDKRFTFDRLREPTSLSELLANYVAGQEAPSPIQVLDHYLNVAHIDTRSVWLPDFSDSQVRRKYGMSSAMAASARAVSEYVDCHCTVWTMESFVNIWAQLSETELLRLYRLQHVFEPARFGNDFVVILKRN